MNDTSPLRRTWPDHRTTISGVVQYGGASYNIENLRYHRLPCVDFQSTRYKRQHIVEWRTSLSRGLLLVQDGGDLARSMSSPRTERGSDRLMYNTAIAICMVHSRGPPEAHVERSDGSTQHTMRKDAMLADLLPPKVVYPPPIPIPSHTPPHIAADSTLNHNPLHTNQPPNDNALHHQRQTRPHRLRQTPSHPPKARRQLERNVL